MKEESFYRVLMVDNDRNEIDKLSEIITTYFKAVVYSASSMKEAILMIDYHTFDFMLINNDAPEFDSFKLSEYVAKSFLNSTSSVILLSTNENLPAMFPRQEDSVIIDFIIKPFKHKELIRMFALYFRFLKVEKEISNRLKKEISLRQFTETELNKSRENFKNIVEKSNAGILIIDQKGIIQFINEAGEKIFLRNKEELIDNPFGMLSGYDKKTEIDIVRKNGEVGIGEITTANTEWVGKPATLVLINDITRHKKMQECLEEAKMKAQESDRLKTAFLANMSHEIRTPLNGILGFSQLLDANNLNTDQKHQYLNTIISCGNYLLGIINDIIDIAQIESGQLIINETNFDLVQLINEIENLYQMNPKLIAKNLQLSVGNSSIDPLIIHSDSLRIRQILSNLINNAIKFTNEGKIKFGFEIKDESHLEFYVQDTGIGIPKSEYENIFDRFRQIQATSDKLNEGNGLGLSIAKALINMLGGKIWLESEENIGTTFYFTIQAQTILSSNSLEEKQNNEVKGSFRNKKILIVEDEEINFFFLKSVIKDYETTIYWAKNGEEAIEIAKNEDVDLILMDIKLPLKNGYEATMEIRRLKPTVPIIAQTAYAMSADKDKAFAAGCNDYIAKPIKINELLLKINNYLN